MLPRGMVLRVNKNNDHLRENALIYYQTLLTNSLKKCMKIGMENLYVDIGAERVKWVSIKQGSTVIIKFLARHVTTLYRQGRLNVTVIMSKL